MLTRSTRSAGRRVGIWFLVAMLGFSSCTPMPDRSADVDRTGATVIAQPITARRLFTAPRFTATDFITTDGTRLPLRKWLPPGQPRAVIVALHGFNDYSRAFEMPATAWAKEGIATFAFYPAVAVLG